MLKLIKFILLSKKKDLKLDKNMEKLNSKNNIGKKFNSLKELGTKSSIREYLKLSGMENPPKIKITAVPMIHAYEENFLKLKEILDKNKPDLLLIEDVTYFEGSLDLIRKIKQEKISKEDESKLFFKQAITFDTILQTFFKPLIQYADKNNIAISSFEEKHNSKEEAINYGQATLSGLEIIYKTDLKKEYEESDINKALEVLKNKSDLFLELFIKNRDESSLLSISKNIRDYLENNKNLKNKSEIKVTFFVGLMHETGFVDKLIERDEEIEVVKINENQISKNFAIEHMIYSLLLKKFFSEFAKDANLNLDDFSNKAVDISKRYNFDMQKYLYSKNIKDYISYILKAKDQKEMNPEDYLLKELEEFARRKTEYFKKNNIEYKF